MEDALNANKEKAKNNVSIEQSLQKIQEMTDRMEFKKNNCSEDESYETCQLRTKWNETKQKLHEAPINEELAFKEYAASVKNKTNLKNEIRDDAQKKIDKRMSEIDFFFNNFINTESEKIISNIKTQKELLNSKNSNQNILKNEEQDKLNLIEDNLTIKRKTYYTSKQIEFLHFLNKFLSKFYWGLVIYFLYAMIIVPKKYQDKKLLSIFACLLLYPYVINSLYDFVDVLGHSISSNLGFNFGKKGSEFITENRK